MPNRATPERALAAAGRAESDLRAQLAAQRRLQQLSAILAAARAKATAGSGNASGSAGGRGGGTAGQIIVRGTWVCPAQGPVSFTDTFGVPRGGRRHQGNDVFSPGGSPLVAVTDGSVYFQGDPLGGDAAYVENATRTPITTRT
jgi:murein DD-endopeptidase MepM/ murein hydrolase activator NlpD